MNKYWLSGIIFLAYGMASPAFSSQTATLTINGRISPPTCSMAMVNGQPQQHCGQLTYDVDTRHQVSSPVKGVTTEVVVAGSDSKTSNRVKSLRLICHPGFLIGFRKLKSFV